MINPNKWFWRMFSITWILIASSCSGIVDPKFDEFAEAWFLTNTLEYSILVQAYYQPLNAEGVGEWYEKPAIPWSNPVLIPPGGTEMIIDYVGPSIIKIFRESDGALLNDAYGVGFERKQNITYKSESSEAAVFFPDGPRQFIDDPRYQTQNVPWDIYPIGWAQSLKERKMFYVDGKAIRVDVYLNPTHPSFN